MADPNYTSGPGLLLQHMISNLTGYAVCIEGQLSDPMIISHRTRTIRIRNGLGFDNYSWLLWRAFVRIVGGKEFAPEFREGPARPRLSLLLGGRRDAIQEGGPFTVPFSLPSPDQGEQSPRAVCPYFEDEPELTAVRQRS